MDAATLNEFIYAMHNKLEQMERWGATVNAAIVDHAEKLDSRAQNGMNAMRLMRERINATERSCRRPRTILPRPCATSK